VIEPINLLRDSSAASATFAGRRSTLPSADETDETCTYLEKNKKNCHVQPVIIRIFVKSFVARVALHREARMEAL